MNVICPICKQGVWVPEGDKLAECGDDVHFTYKQIMFGTQEEGIMAQEIPKEAIKHILEERLATEEKTIAIQLRKIEEDAIFYQGSPYISGIESLGINSHIAQMAQIRVTLLRELLEEIEKT